MQDIRKYCAQPSREVDWLFGLQGRSGDEEEDLG